jgi:quinol monooxygenase YgiN
MGYFCPNFCPNRRSSARISRHTGNQSVRLMRDVRNTGRLVSVGKWNDAEAVRAFKSAPEFKEQLARIVKLAKDFEPTELVTMVKAAGGTSERLSPPAGLEPIHAPT